MTKIKICGITNLEDALKVAELGADYIGFIFVEESPRKIKSISELSQIVKNLPKSLIKIGVFANHDVNFVNETVKELHLDIVQLHGSEDSNFIKKMTVPVWKVIKVGDEIDPSAIKNFSALPQVQAIMVDRFQKDKLGGTGKTFNWDLMTAIKNASSKPVILSGGLKPDNLKEALQKTQPFAVDMSSGVETSPGKKDHTKLKQVIEIAHAN